MKNLVRALLCAPQVGLRPLGQLVLSPLVQSSEVLLRHGVEGTRAGDGPRRDPDWNPAGGGRNPWISRSTTQQTRPND